MVRASKAIGIVILLSILVAIGTRGNVVFVTSERIPTVGEELDSLVAVISIFREHEASYPASLEELVERGYLPRLPTDFWGIPYNYSIDQPLIAPEEQPYHVWTLGRDNLAGGEGPDGDVGNW